VIYAIISDVHANAEALSAVLEDAARQGAEKVISLGDTVGYGPMPAAAVKLVREHCEVVLAGNHDDAVCGRTGAEGFIDLAGEAVVRHREELPAADLKWLKSSRCRTSMKATVLSRRTAISSNRKSSFT
jgi:predicted phosphodiesterase